MTSSHLHAHKSDMTIDTRDLYFDGKTSVDFFDEEQQQHARQIRVALGKKPFSTILSVFVTGIWLLPRNIGIALMLMYRRFISPLYGNVCKYYPTCSDYTMQVIRNNGLIYGIILGSWRILRCNPWSSGGIDKPRELPKSRYALTKRGFVYLNPTTIFNGSFEVGTIEKGI